MLIFLLIIILIISSYALHEQHSTQRAKQIRAQRKAALYSQQKHPEG